MKSKIRIILEIVLCISILALLISQINIRETIEIFKSLEYTWIILGSILYIISLLITAYSLKVLFDSIKYTSFTEWMSFYVVGFSMGLILPGRAGDLSIIYFAKQKGFDIGEVPITWNFRKYGKSNVNSSELLTSLYFVLKMRVFD